MATATYKPLGTYFVSGPGIDQVVFSNIPNTFKDLVLVATGRTSANRLYEFCSIDFNGGGGSYYAQYWELGGGQSAGSSTSLLQAETVGLTGSLATSAQLGMIRFTVYDYASSAVAKNTFIETSCVSYGNYKNSNTWNDTSPITSVRFKTMQGATLNGGARISLYGLG